MSFWRREVIDFALDRETAAHIREQKEWIAREPRNARPWYNLAQLYRIEQKQDEALALLLEAVRLDDSCADAHVALVSARASSPIRTFSLIPLMFIISARQEP